MERYPHIEDAKIKSWILSSSEFSVVNNKVYFWVNNREAYDVTTLIKWPFLLFEKESLNLITHIEDIKWPYISLAWDLESYVKFLSKTVKCNKPVLLNFSGGKDSIASLVTLLKLGCEVRPVYSYVNYLDSTKTQKFLDLVEKKLGIEIIRVEAGGEAMKSMLEKGMPFRGNRWCTYMKVKPIRQIQKKCDCLRASGERLTEALKRFKISYKKKRIPIQDGIKIRPIYPLTLIDVVKITRELNLIHPDYLKGLPRVACVFCPYKTLFEFEESDFNEVEDPGVIESAIKASYRRFNYKMSFEEFKNTHSWRFPPQVANFFHRLRKSAENTLNLDMRRMYRSVWIEKLPKPHIVDVERGFEILSKVLSSQFEMTKRIFEATRVR